ncbi:TPA: AlpA family transcriptional regulator [Pseudomonas aeruginosa]|nr:AlpA family transcriptional regulator [Pseudomonas aeruginosa]
MHHQDSPSDTMPPIERHILRRDEVERLTGFKRAHIYNLMRQGKFPKARRIGLRAVGWDSLEIQLWVAKRLNEHD